MREEQVIVGTARAAFRYPLPFPFCPNSGLNLRGARFDCAFYRF
jgi:hypothetical protein